MATNGKFAKLSGYACVSVGGILLLSAGVTTSARTAKLSAGSHNSHGSAISTRATYALRKRSGNRQARHLVRSQRRRRSRGAKELSEQQKQDLLNFLRSL